MKIPAPHGHLEADLREAETASPRGAAIVCHPHPLHGGTMHTKAVFRAAQALSEVGVHVLRFNFRGVGVSSGSYDQGIGERDDVRAALDWLVAEMPELPIVVGGFSFGSMVGLSVGVDDERVAGLLGLGLPVDMYDFHYLAKTDKPILVVQGEHDEFGSGDEVDEALDGLGSHITLVRVAGADHYFNDRFDELRVAIRDHFTKGPGAAVLTRPAEEEAHAKS